MELDGPFDFSNLMLIAFCPFIAQVTRWALSSFTWYNQTVG